MQHICLWITSSARNKVIYQHRCTVWLLSATKCEWSHVKRSEVIGGRWPADRPYSCMNLVFQGNYGKSLDIFNPNCLYPFIYWICMQNIHRTLWEPWHFIVKNIMTFCHDVGMGSNKRCIISGQWLTRRCLNGSNSVLCSHWHGVMYFLMSGASVTATGLC